MALCDARSNCAFVLLSSNKLSELPGSPPFKSVNDGNRRCSSELLAVVQIGCLCAMQCLSRQWRAFCHAAVSLWSCRESTEAESVSKRLPLSPRRVVVVEQRGRRSFCVASYYLNVSLSLSLSLPPLPLLFVLQICSFIHSFIHRACLCLCL